MDRGSKLKLVFEIDDIALPEDVVQHVKTRMKEALVETVAAANLGGAEKAQPLRSASFTARELDIGGGGHTTGLYLRYVGH